MVFAKQNKTTISNMSPRLFSPAHPPPPSKVIEINKFLGGGLNRGFRYLTKNVLTPVVQKVDSSIHWINLYPVESAIGFPNTSLLDRDLSDG